jgi:two-component sensor histidine kinase
MDKDNNNVNNSEKDKIIAGLQEDIVQFFQETAEENDIRVLMKNIFNTVYEPILILDAEFNVVLANVSFYKDFNCTEKDTLSKSLFALGDNKWDTFGLKSLLEGIIPYKGMVQNYKLQIKSPTEGLKTYLLNARNIHQSTKERKFIFLTFADVTDRIKLDEQKTTLINEMNHRVKNNLVVIQALLKLQAREVKDDISKGYFIDTQARVQSISLIHEMLYHSTNLSNINFHEYISKLLKRIAQCYSESRIETELNVPIIYLDLDKMLPLGLIVTELVTNSYKYAFPENRTGKIIVQLTSMGDNNLILTVKDNGIGIPHDFDINKTDSFGMKIVTALVAQVSGEFEIMRDGGAAFVIKFKNEKQTNS